MEFQFGTNWANYSIFMGDIFGSPLAIEALVAFFLESTFLAAWLFGWNKLSPKMHLFSIWMVALGTHLSAIWIIIANGWMQNPVGYVIRNNRAELVDFMAVITNPYAWHIYFHTLLSCYVLSAFVVLGICAYHFLKKNEVDFFKRSFSYAIILALVASVGVAASGHLNGQNVARLQPSKFAATESLWETQKNVPFYLLILPDEENETNKIEAFGIPGLTSFMAFNDFQAEITGLKDIPPDKRPPVAITFWSFRLMVALGFFFILMSLLGIYLKQKKKLIENKLYLKILLYTIPLPYVAINLGWTVTEVGRQPWVVYGLMLTKDAVSPIPASYVTFSLIAMIILYSFLVVLDIYLLAKNARLGPAKIS
jgi:cytochrome d ubiquinol oxidase subunit I